MVSELNINEVNPQRTKLHPHKFIMWIAVASIIMLFAGLTSAFIVKSNMEGWMTIETPTIFWVSTVVIIASSICMHLAIKAYKARNMATYRSLMSATLILGIGFIVCQILGFRELWNENIRFIGVAGAGQFLYVIFGVHAVHVIGGIIALIVMVAKTYFGKTKLYSAVPVEVMAIYWHFVDILWVYLLIFFIIIGGE